MVVDKSLIQALNAEEAKYLNRYYSLVLTPILLRELQSMLAKEPKKNEDFQSKLSILAKRVDSIHSYIPPNASSLAGANLMGQEIPMTGQVPLGNSKMVRTRAGTYGAIFDEPPEQAILRRWKQGYFLENDKTLAKKIRQNDHSVDLLQLQKEINGQLNNFPNFKELSDIVKWLDNNFFDNVSQELHLRYSAHNLLDPAETEHLVTRWKDAGQPLFSKLCPYAFYIYRCHIIYIVGLGKGLIPSAKSEKTHLDIQYIYYLPFCMTFTSSDGFMLSFARFFARENQSIILGEDLKRDLKQVSQYFFALSLEQKKTINDEYGEYPPEKAAPLTAAVWADHMLPRQKIKDAAPELSKEQNKQMAHQIRTFLKDSVSFDTNRTSDPIIAQKWLNISIIERGIHFTNEVLNIIGISADKDWGYIKRNFNSEYVRKIYDLHADIWRPDDNHVSLAENLRIEERSRFLYLGEIEPEEIAKNIWSWSLHFDQILIPDPFLSPWAYKEEGNPLSNPTHFETDTLKLAYLLVLLYPLIMSKKVVFIPDPSDFNPVMKKAFTELVQKNRKNPKLAKLFMLDKEKLHSYQTKAQLRVYSRLPEAVLRKQFDIDTEQHLKALSALREMDPLCLDRVSNPEGNEYIFLRSGASFETSIILAALYGATPISNLNSRYNHYLEYANKPTEHTAYILNLFEQTPGFRFLDPDFASLMAEKGALCTFREIIKLILGTSSIPEQITLENMIGFLEDVEEDCEILGEIFAKRNGYDCTKLIGKFSLKILYSKTGFVEESVLALASSWFPDLKLPYPLHFIKLPD